MQRANFDKDTPFDDDTFTMRLLQLLNCISYLIHMRKYRLPCDEEVALPLDTDLF